MRYLIMLTFCLCAIMTQAQIVKSTSTDITFFSKAPLEDIEAENKEGKSLIKTSTNDIAWVVSIRGFHFEKPLMEEHFNENYMETEKGKEYKTASFKGKINEEIDWTKDGVYKVTATGMLTIHAVSKKRTLEGELEIKDGKVMLISEFKVNLEDHDIEIPKMVLKNIAETVDVKVAGTYEASK